MATVKEARLHITSTIENLDAAGLPEGETEKNETRAVGYLHLIDGTVLLTYKEEQEGGSITTEVKYSDGRARVIRHGALESDIEFAEGTSHSSVYAVGPYKFDIDVNTKKIRCTLSECGGRLDLIYDMKIGGAQKSARMRIEVSTD